LSIQAEIIQCGVDKEDVGRASLLAQRVQETTSPQWILSLPKLKK
jgi:hypothetical protein